MSSLALRRSDAKPPRGHDDAQPFHRADVFQQASLASSRRSCQTLGAIGCGTEQSFLAAHRAWRWCSSSRRFTQLRWARRYLSHTRFTTRQAPLLSLIHI